MKPAMSKRQFAAVQARLAKDQAEYRARMNRAVCTSCGAAVLRRDERSPWIHVGPCVDLPEDSDPCH